MTSSWAAQAQERLHGPKSVKEIAAPLAVCAALAGCGSGSEGRQGSLAEDSDRMLQLPPAGAIDGWTIRVSVEPSIVAPIVVSVRPARPATRNDARPWVRHELVFENRGDRPIQFADTETSAFIGPSGHRRRLLAADESCGYGYETPKSPIEARVCLALINAFAVKPHASVSRTLTLFKGLRGMERLAPGTYAYKRLIRFRLGREIPPPGTGRTAVLKVVYEVERGSR